MMDIVDLFKALIIICLALFFVVIGAKESGNGWRGDCEKLGKHVSNNKVYICYLEKP